MKRWARAHALRVDNLMNDDDKKLTNLSCSNKKKYKNKG